MNIHGLFMNGQVLNIFVHFNYYKLGVG
ncbi:uncharacterized protein METZ01_LOCUS14853 [marine metagenome]|uniref:Uncharacterized protein n=1 Tax=marine metagenome TaxID=408172 RepID=A0A381P6V0_9ZZZZ